MYNHEYIKYIWAELKKISVFILKLNLEGSLYKPQKLSYLYLVKIT
jgi:hypothetical protein